MAQVSFDLVKELSTGAEFYLDQYETDDELLEAAAESWAYADATVLQTRPTVDSIKKLLQDIVKNSVKELAIEKRDITTITLTFATETLLIYIVNELGWSLPREYLIPLKMVVALVYRHMLQETGKRL